MQRNEDGEIPVDSEQIHKSLRMNQTTEAVSDSRGFVFRSSEVGRCALPNPRRYPCNMADLQTTTDGHNVLTENPMKRMIVGYQAQAAECLLGTLAVTSYKRCDALLESPQLTHFVALFTASQPERLSTWHPPALDTA